MIPLLERTPKQISCWTGVTPDTVRFGIYAPIETRYVDIAVIGGGPAGEAAAYEAMRNGARTALFEAKSIGHNVCNSTAIIDGTGRGQYDLNLTVAELGENARRVFDENKKAYEELKEVVKRHKICCEMIEEGQIDFYKDGDDTYLFSVKALKELGYKEGVDFRIIDEANIREYMDNAFFTHGIWLKDGLVINPLAFCRDFARILHDNGVEIYENSPVLRITSYNDRVEIITPEGILTADKVIMATNPYTINIEGLPLSIRKSIVPIFQTIAVSTPLPDGLVRTRAGWSESGKDAGLVHAFGRIHDYEGQRRLVVGEGAIQPVYMSNPVMSTERYDKLFGYLFPFEDIKTDMVSGGFIGQTPDTKGLEGFLDDKDRVYLCCIKDGFLAALKNGKKAALHILGTEKSKELLYRKSPLNTAWQILPDGCKDFVAGLYLKLFR